MGATLQRNVSFCSGRFNGFVLDGFHQAGRDVIAVEVKYVPDNIPPIYIKKAIKRAVEANHLLRSNGYRSRMVLMLMVENLTDSKRKEIESLMPIFDGIEVKIQPINPPK